MKSRVESLLLCIFLLFSVVSFGQQTFEPGYFIDGNGKREAVEILLEDWRYNPAKIQVRRAADQPPITIPTEALREFGIDGKARFVNRAVAIEKSATSRTTRATTPPVQRVERVLLRVDVEGKASLYSYLTPQTSKHFFSLDGGQLHQLVYATHRAPDGRLSETRTFVRQLQCKLSCDAAFVVDDDLKYQLADLTRVVADYNRCANGETQTIYDYQPPRERRLHFSVQPGIYLTKLNLYHGNDHERLQHSAHRAALRIGVAAEYTLPYADYALSLLFRPSYYRFSASAPLPVPWQSEYRLDYAAIDLPLALRYYYSLCDDVRLFTGGGLGFVAPFGKLYENGEEIDPLRSTLSTSAEIGFRYRGRYDLAIGYEARGNCVAGERLRATTPGLRITTGYTFL